MESRLRYTVNIKSNKKNASRPLQKRKWHNYLENNVLEIFSFLFDYRDLSGYQMIYLCIFKLVGQVKRFVTNYV